MPKNLEKYYEQTGTQYFFHGRIQKLCTNSIFDDEKTNGHQMDKKFIENAKQPIGKDILNGLISSENFIFLYVCGFEEIDLQAILGEK